VPDVPGFFIRTNPLLPIPMKYVYFSMIWTKSGADDEALSKSPGHKLGTKGHKNSAQSDSVCSIHGPQVSALIEPKVVLFLKGRKNGGAAQRAPSACASARLVN
jgi:hypothetical protein